VLLLIVADYLAVLVNRSLLRLCRRVSGGFAV
jgi:hypothetical protein